MIGIEPHFAAISTARPFLQVAIVPTAADGLATCRFAVGRVLVVFGIVLDVVMNAILFVAEYIIVVSNTLQQVDRFLAFVPRLLGELDAARRCKSCYLILHSTDAMMD